MHICYLHTPTRYYWSDYVNYLRSPGFGILNPIIRLIMPLFIAYMRLWDFAAAARIDHIIANSHTVAERVGKYYRQPATVINPPIKLSRFKINKSQRTSFILAGRMIPYKRPDIAVEACRDFGLRLVVVGEGSELPRLKQLAGPRTKFIGKPTDEEMAYYLGQSKAMLFMAEEDFGLITLEAMACGTPVIAYGAGGSLETVIPGKTGVLCAEQTVDSLKAGIEEFNQSNFNPAALRDFAAQFDEAIFVSRIKRFVAEKLEESAQI